MRTSSGGRGWGTLKDTFAAVPDEFGIVGAVIRQFVPRPEDERPFFERMTIRVSPRAPINDPTSPWRPGSTVAHRADPNVVVLHAGYSIVGTSLRPLPGWFPFEILHFPFRTAEQWLRKTSRRAFGDKSLAIYVKGFAAGEAGRADEVYGSVGVDNVTVARGVEDGVLAEDTRLRDALRSVRNGGAVPTELQPDNGAARTVPGRDALDFPADASALYDATLVRFQRRVEDVAARARTLAAVR